MAIVKKAFLFTPQVRNNVTQILFENRSDHLEDIQFMCDSLGFKKFDLSEVFATDFHKIIRAYFDKNPKECGEWLFYFEGLEYDDFSISELADNLFIFKYNVFIESRDTNP